MWLSTLEIVTEQLRPVKEIATTGKNTLLMCEQSLYPVWFSRLRKSYPVQCVHLSDMWLSTLEIVTEQLRPVKEIATTGKNTLLMCEQSLYPVWFLRLRKSYPVLCVHLSDMWLSTLEIVAARLRPVKEIATTGEITVLMCEQSRFPVWFSRLRKSYTV